MERKFKIQDLRFKIQKKVLLSIPIFLFLIFNLLLSISLADDINARSAVVMEESTGRILYAKNPNLRLPPASTTKLMTAILVMENADLSESTSISKHITHVAPLKAGFKEGDEVTIETLLYAALLESANDAAVALAEAVAGSEQQFVNLMNKKAVAMGLTDTRFINSHGLPGPGQYTTAFDLARIMRYALRYPKLREIIGTRVAGVLTEGGNELFLKNTNRLLWSEEDLIGGKTGYTRQARHCFVCAAEREKETVIVALLGSPSRSTLWREAEELIGRGFQVIANNEEAVIFFTKADYDFLNMKKASYKKKSKFKIKSSKLKKKKKMIANKRVKHKKSKVAKKKIRTKVVKLRNYKVAKKIENGNKG
ncbi:MAG: D-alanyl-D-alanine carboxypeptidase [Nitrospirae bacterium]|nr:D-alanyl-D-alanine carboxypeptidase [Nitrospirota bacterium]